MNDTSESTPLLGGNHEDVPQAENPSPTEDRHPMVIVTISAIICFIEISSFLPDAPQIAIFENIACKNYYSSGIHTLDEPNSERCKIEPIQSEVALINSWKITFETIPGIALALSYGALADRIGRKKVLICAMTGCLFCDLWVRVVCLFSDTLPLRLVWFSGVWQLIGGGAPVMGTLFFIMVADACPTGKMITAFSQIQAGKLLSESLSIQLGATLMSINPWIPFMGSSVIMIIGICFTAIFIPETSTTLKTDQVCEGTSIISHAQESQAPSNSLVVRVREEALRIIQRHYASVKQDFRVVLILLSFFVFDLGSQVGVVLLQYSSEKFHWSFAKASRLISLRAGVNLFVLVILMPTLSDFILGSSQLPAAYKDKRLTQINAAFLMLGSLTIFLAPSPPVMILGQILFALGSAFAVTARSLITSLTEKEHLATIYTGISVARYAGALTGAPLLATTFQWGMKWGDAWVGLPFLVVGGLFASALLLVSVSSMELFERSSEPSEEASSI